MSIATFLLFLSWWIRNKDRIREKLPRRLEDWEKIEDETYRFINSFERDQDLEERPYTGAIIFMIAVGFTFLVFPETAAILAVLILSISDSASTLVGIHLGESNLPHNRDKSFEGSSAFFLTATVMAFLFTSPLNSVLIALGGAFAESLPHIDDNFSVPITVAVLFILL
ncbi:MAG: diacylglycerol/polyprenol kinase family protein [Candidatus Aenigmatarchaeota archaeon]